MAGDSTGALLKYWRNSLADVDLRSPEVKEDRAFRPTLEEVLAGRLSAGKTREILGAAEAERGKSPSPFPVKDRDHGDKLFQVPVLISPFGLRRRFEHGVAAESDIERIDPLWIPAVVLPDGALRGADAYSPWIGRDFLEPVSRDVPVVGRLEELDRFLTVSPSCRGTDWAQVIEYTGKMMAAVMGQRLGVVEIPGFEALEPVAILWNEDRRIGRSILDLYDKTMKREAIPPLLRTLAAGTAPAPAPAPYALAEPALQHCGQMSGAFPLSPSQRQTVHALMTLAGGSLLAVNGPPGTGKTTVLQSIVASLWVQAALDGKRPPILLACSTNNQAVTNILDSFETAAAASAVDPWAERWLPDLTSYGLYLPSSTKFGDSKYQKASPGPPFWRGLPEKMEKPAYVRQAEAEYLENARAALPGEGIATIEKAVGALHALLSELHCQMAAWISDAREIETLRLRHGCTSHEEAVSRVCREREELAAVKADRESLYQELLSALENIPFWEDLLSFLPPVRERRDRRLSLPFLRRNQQPPAAGGKALPHTLLELVRSARDEVQARLDAIEAWGDREARLAAWLAESGESPLDEPGKVLDVLDRLRYRMFLVAGRYWEGRWLLEMKGLLAADWQLKAQSRTVCEERFRRFAMLTPCMVATFHSAPRAFDYYDRDQKKSAPLFETIDLLIVDEAGQVSPEVGAATFALAKRALVVGDIHQIEPVWGVPPAVDAANLREVGIEPPGEEAGEDGTAFRASLGSLMLMARRATALTCEEERGLFLSEHRRCVPEVIRFCNELVYRGRLRALRPPQQDRILPAIGWAHVTSPALADGGSRSNPGEAGAIADWLDRHRGALEHRYGLRLREIVAVITPFAAQRWRLERAFREKKLEVPVGTVHTFQGAERPVVIFSPVYSLAGAPRFLFFDGRPNLLNVAVSRAKDSFLVFGDMRVFDPRKSHLPSGKLAQIAFESEDNEVTDVESAQHLQSKPGARRISTLAGHREILGKALKECTERVLIVSPYLTQGAVAADGVPAAIASARQRGVRVCVTYSPGLCQWRESAEKVAERLGQAGAEIRAADRMHNKTLAVDDSWIVEGSFNWLSARRDEGHPHQNHESSICYEGPEAGDFIQRAWREVTGVETPGDTPQPSPFPR